MTDGPCTACLQRKHDKTATLYGPSKSNFDYLPKETCMVYAHARQDQMCLGFRNKLAGMPKATLAAK